MSFRVSAGEYEALEEIARRQNKKLVLADKRPTASTSTVLRELIRRQAQRLGIPLKEEATPRRRGEQDG